MNKFVKTVLCLALGAFLFNSCVSNEESEGVKALREAKAREINADAHEKEIANLEAELIYLQNQSAQDVNTQVLIAKAQADLVDAKIKLYEAEAGVANAKILAIKAN